MFTITESDLSCGCCIEMTVSDEKNTVVVVSHNIEEGIEKAKKMLTDKNF